MPSVTMSSKVAAKPEAIWQAIGGFGAIADWHPMIEKADLTGPAGPGTVRTLQVVGGGKIVERLERVSESERRYSYAIVDGPFPVRDYKAEMQVTDNGDGTSTVRWTSTFEPVASDPQAMVQTFEGIYRSGLENIQKMFNVRVG